MEELFFQHANLIVQTVMMLACMIRIKAVYGVSMKIQSIPDVRIAEIDVQMMRIVGEWIVTKIERHYHSGQNSFHAYGESLEPQQTAHQTIQIIRVVGRIITVIFKISTVKENTFQLIKT